MDSGKKQKCTYICLDISILGLHSRYRVGLIHTIGGYNTMGLTRIFEVVCSTNPLKFILSG